VVTPLTARAHAYVADLEAPALTEDDRHHLGRVLRMPIGADLTVGTGDGAWRACRLQDGLALAAAGPVVRDPAPAPALTVGFALVKGERPEWAVQKLTELGVDRIVPFLAERSVVRWDDAKVARQAQRWRDIARGAGMQSRRTWLPDVAPVAPFAEVAALAGAVLADAAGAGPSLAHPVVLVGTEGGWSAAERGSGLRTVQLGDDDLRADTAAITAGAIFAALRSGLVATT